MGEKGGLLRSHGAVIVLGSFPKVQKTGQRSEISRKLGWAALEGRDPVVEAGKKEGPKHHPQLCLVPGSAGWGGREAELTPKPGEVGTGKLMPPEVEGEQEISQRK